MYKNGVQNKADDGLSRLQGSELLAITVSTLALELLDRVRASWAINVNCSHIIELLKEIIYHISASRKACYEGREN